MNPSILTSLVLGAALVLARGEDAGDVRPTPSPVETGSERIFGDGILPDWLRVYDVDADGVLSEEERVVARLARREVQEARTDSLTALWDTNDDGTLSQDEIDRAREANRTRIIENRAMRFDEADTDADGNLTGLEFRSIPAIARLEATDPGLARLIFQRLDRDANGVVSKEEFLAHLQHNPPSLGAAQRTVERDP